MGMWTRIGVRQLEAARGFTLTELVVTVAIVGALVTAASLRIGRRDAHTRSAVLGAAAPALAKASRVVMYSDAGPADAIALALPPDVRGRVEMNPIKCADLSPAERGAADELCDVSFAGNNFYYTMYAGANLKVMQIKVDVLRAGNPPFFERLDTSYVPIMWPRSEGHSLLAACRSSGANVVSHCTTDCETIPTSQTFSLVSNSVLETRVKIVSGYVAGVSPPIECDTVGSGWVGSSYCYYNGTCDPATFWFAAAPHSTSWVRNGDAQLSRITLSYTGSLSRYNSW